ncbi:hypothetical protein [Neorhizobium galegae]|uniref:hypothetical protein n=1 Tax=Neorhizobium galegae TaxID=399 RepID=UPI002103983F|nr:hypothetical protein [Neorhizobium galegae]MCQ1850933.1 hypothetical protein [Neorhizobium galegae]
MSCLSNVFARVPAADNKKAASGSGRLVVLSMDMTGQGRVERAGHQLAMVIEFIMGRIVSWGFRAAQANFHEPETEFWRCDATKTGERRLASRKDRRNAAEKDTACSIRGSQFWQACP